ncbi:MAG TPA: LptA/OstA family protein [Candidatus Angelobacter sp.]|nr:LptA/OstA family protein [Candidatus Angelobacter sp.]
MALDPRNIRRIFAAAAVLIILIVAAVYIRGILRSHVDLPHTTKNITPGIQVATGFTYSHSEGGKTLFTIHAANVQQYTGSGKAALHDVSIIVYGRNQDRSDQIYGADFSYDPAAKIITAEGDVRIDLEASSASGTDQTPAAETRNLIHVKTSGLSFNENTGIAQTPALIEFRVPEANGSAVGATYDSHGGVLTLKSAVKITTTGKRKATITGRTATITKDPSKVILQSARVEQPQNTISADKVTVFMRDDNNVDHLTASGNLQATREGPKGYDLHAAEGEVMMADANQARSGTLSGGVTFTGRGDSPAEGKAQQLFLTFGPENRLAKARAENAVQLKQGLPGKSQELRANAVDVVLTKDGRRLEKGSTSSGPAEIVMDKAGEKTTISAGRFETTFNAQNRPSSLYGTPDTKIVDSAPGKPDRILTARELRAKFDDKGEIVSAEQSGDFHYQEGTQTATAERADYRAADETIGLTGSPRVIDSASGTLTADSIQLNRKTRNAFAQNNVKTTYTGLKAQPNGAMLGGSDPVHVTGTSMIASTASGVARYTQGRLWQGSNIVEAPSISFDRNHRSLQAQGDQTSQVASVFVQKGKDGKLTPVNVSSDRLSYVDSDRKAVFAGRVLVKAQDTTINADHVDVILLPKGAQQEAQGASQLDRIVAQGDIHIQQAGRRATGNQLVYTAAEDKMVLTGTEGHRPSIFDAERGEISGDSLTFFTHNGRVLVGSGETSQTQTPTIRDASKK